MTACTRSSAAPPVSMIQIRRGYTTACYDLRLSVETDAAGWKAQVRDRNDGRTLYSAYRCNPGAARLAATEFVVFRMAGAGEAKSPEAMSQHLRWNEYW
jgi:hypothetical protein